MGLDGLALGVVWYVVFVFSLTCHEAAHAFTAHRLGDDTAYLGGQVTLNPIPHMQRSPVGTIVVPILTFFFTNFQWMMGWASAPFDPMWQQRYPKRAAWMALAGPLANLAIVLITAAIMKIGMAADVFEPPIRSSFATIVVATESGSPAIATFLSIMFALNLLLFVFNLIPVPPLDGFSVAGLFMREETMLRFINMSHNPTFSLLGILVAWNAIKFVFPPAFFFSLRLLYAGHAF